MSDFFSTIIGSFLNRAQGSRVSAYAIIILIGSMLWMLDHYSIISRIDTNYTTGNMVRIAETRALYNDNPVAQNALDEMLENELNHKSVVYHYTKIFALSPKANNGLSPLCNTLTTIGLFPIIMIPLLFVTMVKDYMKAKTPLIVELLSFLTVFVLVTAIVWIAQWLTSLLPPIFEKSYGNIVLNIAIQILFLCAFVKYLHISAKVRANNKNFKRE